MHLKVCTGNSNSLSVCPETTLFILFLVSPATLKGSQAQLTLVSVLEEIVLTITSEKN